MGYSEKIDILCGEMIILEDQIGRSICRIASLLLYLLFARYSFSNVISFPISSGRAVNWFPIIIIVVVVSKNESDYHSLFEEEEGEEEEVTYHSM